MAQVNPTVGDLKGNTRKVASYIERASAAEVDVVAFPEMVITGYPPMDLIPPRDLRRESDFVERNIECLQSLVREALDVTAVIGFVDRDAQGLYNAAAVLHDGRIIGIAHKTLLPTYDVFDELRYFTPAKRIEPIVTWTREGRTSLGVSICEDIWDEGYETKVTEILAQQGAELIININASPFHAGKRLVRENLLKEKALRDGLPIFYVNMVGGQDELVFDGQSLAFDKMGRLIGIGKQFEEDLVIVDVDIKTGLGKEITAPQPEREEEMFNALVLGVRDYFRKTGFKKAVVGMSGGIDSSLTTAIAAEALGRENVIGVSMPSEFSSDHSKTDTQLVARNLGILYITIPIQSVVDQYKEALQKPLEEIRRQFGVNAGRDDPVADENLQPRTRGNILMDISNRLKDLRILVLNTGNKTELALGYCTLYGDMAGGLGVLSDVSKLEVYNLARYVNRRVGRQIIPETVFKKKPSPELRADQFDPFDFDIVSPMVDKIIENRRGKRELLEMGYPRDVVEDAYDRIRAAEYKRRQAAPGIKITPKAFGIGWKMPIVNQYRED